MDKCVLLGESITMWPPMLLSESALSSVSASKQRGRESLY